MQLFHKPGDYQAFIKVPRPVLELCPVDLLTCSLMVGGLYAILSLFKKLSELTIGRR
jgi:hypothetical protein